MSVTGGDDHHAAAGTAAPLPSFPLAPLLGGDPSPGPFEVGSLDAFEEAEQVEPGRRERVARMFDIGGWCGR